MPKKFYLTKRNNIWYVRFYNPFTKSMTSAKSTRTTDRNEAELISMKWLVNNKIPNRKEEQKSLNEINIEQYLRENSFESGFAKKIIEIMKNKGIVETAIIREDNDLLFVDYLYSFWDYEKSEYVREKIISGHRIHLSHCKANQRIATQQYKEYFTNKLLKSVTLKDMKEFRNKLIESGLSASRINNVLRTGVTALKQAYFNKLTENNCFNGLVFCGKVNQKKKNIFTLEEVDKIFKLEWKDEQAKLANELAYTTGMRLGEIRALRLCDIGKDRIYVRHSFNITEGLKTCKNGECREVVLPIVLRDKLIKRAKQNPFDKTENAYVFWGRVPNKPIDAKTWIKGLNFAKKELGITRENITFHSWRHLFVTEMSHLVDIKKLQQITGHKTEVMIELYSNHKQESVFKELEEKVNDVFTPMLN